MFLSFCFMGAVTSLFAQQPPIPDMQQDLPVFKSWLVYGDLGFNNQVNDNSANGVNGKYTNLSVNPGIGYRLNEHLVVGLQGGFAYSKSSTDYSGYSYDNKTDNWSLGIFLRHYCCGIGKTFYYFSQLNVGYQSVDAYPNDNYASATYNPLTADQIINGYGIAANWYPALGIHLAHDYALELNMGGIGYSYMTQDHGNGTNSGFDVTFAHEIKIGVSKLFNFHRSDSRAFHEPDVEMHNRSFERMGNDDEDGGSGKQNGHKVHDMDDE